MCVVALLWLDLFFVTVIYCLVVFLIFITLFEDVYSDCVLACLFD